MNSRALRLGPVATKNSECNTKHHKQALFTGYNVDFVHTNIVTHLSVILRTNGNGMIYIDCSRVLVGFGRSAGTDRFLT